jgi:cyclic pyranopterin phosphate synthase
MRETASPSESLVVDERSIAFFADGGELKRRFSMAHHLADSFGRRIRVLRVSLTDHCNFRCVYCMPPEGLPHIDKTTYLSRDDIARFVSVTARMGVGRYRLTGGEPLLRRDVVDIVARLRDIDGVDELSMTTNGSLLGRLAAPLRRAGLDRLNISLDSLDPDRFESITLVSQYERVREGITTAIGEGFPVKINVVIMNGLPDSELLEFVQLAVDHDIDVRFLEFMPLCGTGWRPDLVYPIGKARDTIKQHLNLTPMIREDHPAETFLIEGGRGRVGFIASLSEPFCSSCSRMRLTADGRIRPCLFSSYEVPVADALRAGDDASLERVIRSAVWNKPKGSEFDSDPFAENEDVVRQTGGAPLIRSLGG